MIGSWSEWPVLVVHWSEASSQLEVRKVRLFWSLPLSCWPSTYPRRRGAQDNSARPCVQATAGTGALVRRLGSAQLCSTPGCSSASSGGERSQLRSSALTSSFAAHWLPHLRMFEERDDIFRKQWEHSMPLSPLLNFAPHVRNVCQRLAWTANPCVNSPLLNFSNYISKLWELTRKVVLDVATTSCQK